MIISIDTQTIVFAIILVNIFMMILIISYRNALKDRPLKLFLAAKICQMAAFISWAFSLTPAGAVDDPHVGSLTLMVGNILFIIAIAQEGLAVTALYLKKQSRIKWIYTVMAAAFTTAYALFYAFGAGEGIRIALVSFFCIVLVIYPAVYLMANKQKSYLQRVVGILYFLIISGLFTRMLIVAGIFGHDQAMQDEGYSWANFALFVMMILASTGYFLLAKEQADIRLLYRANTDSLTGVLNRRAFFEQGQRIIRYFERKKEPVTFMIFDIDGFKKVNDVFGHYVGDIVLKEVSGVVQENLRGYDYFGRYGGDEFTVLLPGADEKDSDLVAERLRRIVESQTIYENTKLRITICIGLVTVVPEKETSVDILFKEADGALYEAKLKGGNTVVRSGGKAQVNGLL